MQTTDDPRSIPRSQAIAEIRDALLLVTDDDHSMCAVAKKLGIGCTGFDQFTDDELRRRYDWVAERRPGISRDELERLANLWQLGRQQVHEVPLSCDTQSLEHGTCLGRDGWDDAGLARLPAQVGKGAVSVVDDPAG